MISRHRYAAGGLIAVALTASPAFSSTSLPYIEEARSAIARGDANAALIQLKKAVKENPTSGEARFELGALEARQGNLVAAEKDLSLARDNDYPPAKVNPLLASVLLAMGENKKLISTVPPCPDDAQCRSDVLASHTRALLALHDLPGADTASIAALEAVPSNPQALLARVQTLMARSDYRSAEETVDSLLAADPKSAEALAVKGDLRRQANDLDGAVDLFNASLAINAGDISVRQRLALALAALNRNDEAAAAVKTVLDQAPEALIAVYLKAILEVRAGKTAEAMDTVRPVEASIEQIPRGIFLLAIIHAANNHLEQALDYAIRFHTGEPGNLVGSKLLASLYYRGGAYAKVIDILGPVQDHFADDSEALQLLGSAYLAEGWIKEANDVLAKVVRIDPGNVNNQARLAAAQTRQPSTRDAGVRELEALVAADAKNVKIGLALLFSYLSQGDYERAIETATNMVAARPDSPLPLTIRGSVWLAKNNESAAVADFKAALVKNRDFVPAASYIAELDMRNEKFEDARKTIDDILSRAPYDLRILMVRARIEARAGNPAAMVPYLRLAQSNHPDESEPGVLLMQVLAGLGRPDEALLVADDLARTQPRNPAVLDLVARTYLSLQQPTKGIELYQRLQNTFPDAPEIHHRLGQTLAALNRLDDARTALDRAVSADRGFIPAWRTRALLELKMKGFDAAMIIVGKAVAQNKTSDEAALLEGDVLTAAGRLPEAEKSFVAALAAHPSSVAAGRVFRVVLQQGDRARAHTVLIDWLRVKPDDAGAAMALAEDDLQSKDYRGAIARYEELLKVFPHNALILNNLAYAYDDVGDPRATEAARAAFQLQPTSGDIIDTYAYLLYRKGDAKRGAELIHRAYLVSPNNPSIIYHFAKVKADAKDFDGARGLLKPIVEAKVVFGDADDARKLYGELGGS